MAELNWVVPSVWNNTRGGIFKVCSDDRESRDSLQIKLLTVRRMGGKSAVRQGMGLIGMKPKNKKYGRN